LPVYLSLLPVLFQVQLQVWRESFCDDSCENFRVMLLPRHHSSRSWLPYCCYVQSAAYLTRGQGAAGIVSSNKSLQDYKSVCELQVSSAGATCAGPVRNTDKVSNGPTLCLLRAQPSSLLHHLVGLAAAPAAPPLTCPASPLHDSDSGPRLVPPAVRGTRPAQARRRPGTTGHDFGCTASAASAQQDRLCSRVAKQ
jgi:hypothetical protein